MAAILPPLETPEERLVFWMIVSTWGLWLIGGLYHLFPLLGWVLVAIALGRRIGLVDDGGHEPQPLPWGVTTWLVGMTAMLVALVAAHIDFDLEPSQFIKSLLGWFKGWGLMAAFIFAGAQLRIKPIVVFRANNILAAQCLVVTPILIVCAYAGVPDTLYVSPLAYLGGPGPTFFAVSTHAWDQGTLGFRLFYFAPWSPAAAFCAHIGLVCGIFDTRWRWRITGILSAVVVCALSQSRLSLIAVPLLLIGLPLMSSLLRAWPAAIAAFLFTIGMLLLTQVKDAIDDAVQAFMGARADSSRVRSALARIAYHRWQTEAPIFGHGVVERGSHLVEFMPIGSHHTWHGLLFVKGALGFAALALPLAWSFFELLAKAQRDAVARAAFGMVLVLVFNSFGENLEILAYLAWPGLLVIGIAAKRRLLVPEVWAGQLRPAFKVHPEPA
jgi:hypothetical protein